MCDARALSRIGHCQLTDRWARSCLPSIVSRWFWLRWKQNSGNLRQIGNAVPPLLALYAGLVAKGICIPKRLSLSSYPLWECSRCANRAYGFDPEYGICFDGALPPVQRRPALNCPRTKGVSLPGRYGSALPILDNGPKRRWLELTPLPTVWTQGLPTLSGTFFAAWHTC